jgi:chromate transport protein ChrA
LLLTFYRGFIIPNLLVTFVCLFLFREYGMSILYMLFLLKLATLALVFSYIRSYKNKEFYYYQNLGLSRAFLWTTTFLFDFFLYLLLLLPLNKYSL